MFSTKKPSIATRLRHRIAHWLYQGPRSQNELRQQLQLAAKHGVINDHVQAIVEGAMTLADIPVAEVMIPKSATFMLDINAPFTEFSQNLIEHNHSRIPIYDGDSDKILGILHAKDLLPYQASLDTLELRDLLRRPIFVPESKPLDVLLRQFQISHNHLAVVINEFGSLQGIVTLENVIEHIVGDISDEFDTDEELAIWQDHKGIYHLKGNTEVNAFNRMVGCSLDEESADTIAGLILKTLGRIPRRAEVIELNGIRFTVFHADSRRIRTLHAEHLNHQ